MKRASVLALLLLAARPAHSEPSKCSAVGRYTLRLTPKGGTCGAPAGKLPGEIPDKFEVQKKAKAKAASKPMPGSLDAIAATRTPSEADHATWDATSYAAVGQTVPPADPEDRGLPPSPWSHVAVRTMPAPECTIELELTINPVRGAPSAFDRSHFVLRVDNGRVKGFVVYSDQDTYDDFPKCADVFAVDGKKE